MREVESFHPYDIAETFIKDFGPFRRLDSVIYRYVPEQGIWSPCGKEELTYLVHSIQEKNWFRTIQTRGGGTAEEYLKLRPQQTDQIVTTVQRTKLDDLMIKDGLSLKNGYMAAGAFNPAAHHPDNFCLRYLDVEHIEFANCPLFLQMLNDIFARDGEDDRSTKIRCLQEFVGACLFGIATRYARILVGIGKGANGKTTLQEVIRRALFPIRARTVSPTNWSKPYFLSSLHGVDFNLVSELPDGEVFSSEYFKAVVTGDQVQARNPGEKPFHFSPSAGHFFSTNELPTGGDLSGGFWRRVIVMPFTQNFAEVSKDSKHDVQETILEKEVPGILQWALEGARRILKTKEYTIGRWHDRQLSAWQKDSDVVLAFLDACAFDYKIKRETVTPFFAIYEDFKIWATLTGASHMSQIKLGRRLNTLGVERVKRNNTTWYRVTLKERKNWNDIRGSKPTFEIIDSEKENKQSRVAEGAEPKTEEQANSKEAQENSGSEIQSSALKEMEQG